MEKFPKLFKRAISFRMNIKLEDFVKEYICMEQDIHIEDLQESVMQYGRMRSKIEETMEEIRRLKLICGKYEQYAEKKSDEEKVCSYQIDRLEIMNHEVKSQEARDRIKVRQEAIEDLKKQQQVLEQEEKDLQKEYEEIILRIADSGYARLESDLDTLNETLERLNNGKVRWGADCRASEGMDGERHYAKSGDLGYRKIRRRKAFPKKSLCACRKA